MAQGRLLSRLSDHESFRWRKRGAGPGRTVIVVPRPSSPVT